MKMAASKNLKVYWKYLKIFKYIKAKLLAEWRVVRIKVKRQNKEITKVKVMKKFLSWIIDHELGIWGISFNLSIPLKFELSI